MPTDTAFSGITTYLDLPEPFYTRTAPTPVTAPKLIVFNHALAEELGIVVSGLSPDELAARFAGNTLPPGAKPLAQAYAGHQFGHFTMLGDGRAHLLTEHITPDDQRIDIQLKGSGRTPYSRGGDGRAVLGPMLREYLIAEAMHALGIPTTRALAVVATGEIVNRETPLPGAILTRIASSHLRVGTFEFASATQDRALLRALFDYTIDRHFPELKDADNSAIALLDAVMRRQSELVTHWLRVGFVHGVMNTDNTTLSGQTIDFGPCAFVDSYHSNTVFSSIDHAGRYAFANQPAIILWNLTRFAETLIPLIDDNSDKAIEKAEAVLNTYADLNQTNWLAMMRAKLGLLNEQPEDLGLITDLLNWMQQHKADYTNTFLALSYPENKTININTCSQDEAFKGWQTRWQSRRSTGSSPSRDTLEASRQLMQKTNPAIIPRNHQVEAALAAAADGDLQPFNDLLSVLQSPYGNRDALTPYQEPPQPDGRPYQTFCGT